MMLIVKYILFACIDVSTGFALNILGIFPAQGYSQYLLGASLMRKLASRGHKVTVIAPHRQNQVIDGYSEVYVDGLENFGADKNLFNRDGEYPIKNVISLYRLGLTFTEHTLANNAVQQFLASNQTFDVVICEQFTSEALYGFSWHFKAPLIVFSSIGPSEWISDKTGHPLPVSYVPHALTRRTTRMDFVQRFQNVFIHIFDYIYRNVYVYPIQNKLAQKYFPGIPHLDHIMYNVSLFLTNSHAATTEPVPITPNIIEVGGLQISPKKLPKDLQDFLDGVKHGAVYFSMGTNLRSTHLKDKYKNAFIRVFSKLKQRVIWKFEDGNNLPKLPSNVLIRKWLPQQDILAHPNVKAFITHGGLISITEATFLGVPMITIPIFGDQRMNVAKLLSKGTTIHLPYKSINEDTLMETLNEILNNTRYYQAAQKLSFILNDQQETPMDRAIYWIEYVHRHRGVPFLKPASLELTWYQYCGFDVLLVTLIICSFPLIIYYLLSKCKRPVKNKLQ
ncbi:UDP-glucuronosyltransferase 1-1-like [Agrilus planipennis]|uniref:UDP-glucuronosyltransferase 1-1-like n=1 Tax=Agrilus planipennis TaxID=224129 RepID=A0A1W4XDE4_AGRPL|nr:UDP-glucuronosyltransferase 1-1-like [Agrilus planipennis]